MQRSFSSGWRLTLLGVMRRRVLTPKGVGHSAAKGRRYGHRCFGYSSLFRCSGLCAVGSSPLTGWAPPPPWAAAWTRGPCPGCTHPGAGRGDGGYGWALLRSFIVVSVFGLGCFYWSLFRCSGSGPATAPSTTARRGPYGPHKAPVSTPRPTHPTHPPFLNRSNIFLCVFLWKLELYRLIFFVPSWKSAAQQTANHKQKCAAAGRKRSPTGVGAGATITAAVVSSRATRIRPKTALSILRAP